MALNAISTLPLYAKWFGQRGHLAKTGVIVIRRPVYIRLLTYAGSFRDYRSYGTLAWLGSAFLMY